MQDRLARQTILSAALALSALQLLFSGPANSLVGADLVDLSLQRYTVIVASAKGHCTGVVLAQNIVLTAAHCVTNMQNLWIGGDRGFGDPSGPPVEFSRVAEVAVHPRYDSGALHSIDLALLRIATPLPDRFLPAFFGASVPSEGDDLVVAGYGMSADKDPMAGKILRMGLLRVARRYKDILMLVSTREQASGAGHGDSGGPVFSYHGMLALVAVMVSGGGIAHATFAVPIAPNYAWIQETMAKWGVS